MYPNCESINTTTSSLFHLPSPNYLAYEDEPIFLQHIFDLSPTHDFNNNNNNSMPSQIQTNNNNMADSNTSTIVDTVVVVPKQAAHQSTSTTTTTTTTTPKKRSSKKDRHSKINTAHGPRDRRMRLSLDVARKFFGLQDMLGFDKASKTVEWLLTKSKSSIKELTRDGGGSSSVGANSASSTSECEVLSGIEDTRVADITKGKGTSGAKAKKVKGSSRRVAFDANARESRVKARERARERTTRIMKRKLQGINESNLSPARDESGTQNSSFEVQLAEVDEPSSRERQQVNDDDQGSKDNYMVFGDSSMIWSPSSTFFNYHHNSTTSSHENQFGEFQVYGKAWEGFNN